MPKFNLQEFDGYGRSTRVVETVNSAQTVKEENPVAVTTAKTGGTKSLQQSDTVKTVPMMNIRFSPENYAYMRKEAAMRGLSVIKFTNYIIDQYRSDPSHVHQNDVYQDESKW